MRAVWSDSGLEADPIVAHQTGFNAGISYWMPKEPPRWRMVKHWRWDAERMRRARRADDSLRVFWGSSLGREVERGFDLRLYFDQPTIGDPS